MNRLLAGKHLRITHAARTVQSSLHTVYKENIKSIKYL